MNELYHIGFPENPHAEYAILTGDPGRVEKIAQYLENAEFYSSNREYTAYLGKLSGASVLVISTGMGGASTAICVEELYQTGVKTFLRVGTCGGMQNDIMGGDLVIATSAIRMEGTTKEYVPIEYPATADFRVVTALEQAAKNLNINHHIGIVQSKDSFYGQHSPERMPIGYELQDKWNAWIKAGCLASEMECAALFVVSGILRARSGAVLSVVWNQERAKQGLPNPEVLDTESAILTAVEAMKLLILQDNV